ncbi:unnamed protein product [Urochloa humidicola]
MAEEVIGSIASVAAGAVADRAVSKLVDNLSNQAPVADKLQRLERLLMRIRSTVEVSEKCDIESAALLQWQEKLRGAVALGDEVLLSFQPPATSPAVADDAQSAPDGRRQALSFTRHALSSIGRRIRTAVTALFSSDADTKKLDGTLEALEKESENIGEFIALLQLEASPNLKRRRVPYIPSGRFGPSPYVLTSSDQLQSKAATSSGHPCTPPISGLAAMMQIASPPNGEELQEETRLVARLQKALYQIDVAVAIVGIRDVSGLEWLAQWADLLRDARQQGSAVLGAIGGGAKASNKETAEYDLEENEIGSFVQTIESLAGDLGVLKGLASLCPYKLVSFPVVS